MTLVAHSSAFRGELDEFALSSFVFGPFSVGIASGAVVLGTDASYPLLTLPFNATVEKITVRATTLAAADPDSIGFIVAPSGTAIGSGTAITANEPMTTNANAALAANTPVDVPFSGTGHKNLASGSTLGLTTTGTIVSLAGLCITVVLRKQPQRTNDAGGTFYVKN